MSGNPGQSHVANTVDVGPLLLLISPASYIGTIAVMTSIGHLYLVTANPVAPRSAQRIGIGWCYASLGVAIFSLYLLNGGFVENIRLRKPVYGNTGFFIATLIVLIEIALTIWTIVDVARIET